MTVPTVQLSSGEILQVGYQSMLDSSPEIMEEPHQILNIDFGKYKKLVKDLQKCGRCGLELETWEINVNIVNYYNKYNRQAKRGRLKRRCYKCACEEM